MGDARRNSAGREGFDSQEANSGQATSARMAVLEQWPLTGCARASSPGSWLHSQRPDTAEAKPLSQLVRAGRVRVSVFVLPLLSPNQVLRNRHYQLYYDE